MSAAIIAALGIGYLLGSIPFGLLLTQLGGLGDVRKIGSGNIGATNVLRTGNKGLAAATLVCDVGKGVVAVLIGATWGQGAMLAAGGAVVLGHTFPVWLGFRGGKGAATALGVLCVIAWPAALVAVPIWLTMAFVFRYQSLAALVATVIAVIFSAFVVDGDRELLIVALAALVIAKHHENIRRLISGKENRISFSKG